MDFNQQPAESSGLELGSTVVDNGNWTVEAEDDIRWETVEGEAELRVELNDSEETLEDGTTVRRQIVTRHRVCPVSDVLTVNDVVTERRRATDRLLDVSIEEDVLLLPPGVDDPDLSDDVRTVTDVQEVEESLDDGTPVYRRITTTTIVPAVPDIPPSSELADHSAGVEFKHTEEPFDRESQFEQSEPNQPAAAVTESSTEVDSSGRWPEPVDFVTYEESTGQLSEPADIVTDVDQSEVGEPRTELEGTDRLPGPAETVTEVHRSELAEPLIELEDTGRLYEVAEPVTGVDRSVGLSDDVTDRSTEIERQAEQVVAQTMEAALKEVLSTSPGWCKAHCLMNDVCVSRCCLCFRLDKERANLSPMTHMGVFMVSSGPQTKKTEFMKQQKLLLHTKKFNKTLDTCLLRIFEGVSLQSLQ